MVSLAFLLDLACTALFILSGLFVAPLAFFISHLVAYAHGRLFASDPVPGSWQWFGSASFQILGGFGSVALAFGSWLALGFHVATIG
jgi:hypothetical protein